MLFQSLELVLKLLTGRAIRVRSCADDDVNGYRGDGPQYAEHLEPREFAQSALELVATHSRLTVFRNDETDSTIASRRSHETKVERRGASALAKPRNCLKIGAARQAIGARKAMVLPIPGGIRRQRTCSGAER
jgi:hypothetical protein